MLVDIGLAADGRIVLSITDHDVDCETLVVMSVDEALALAAHLQTVAEAAAAIPEGRRLSLDEGRA